MDASHFVTNHLAFKEQVQWASERIKLDEGFRDKVYKDTRGLWTIGYGHLCEDQNKPLQTITQMDGDRLFLEDLNNARIIWERVLNDNGVLIPYYAVDIYGVGLNMAFQMGNRIRGFKNFLSALSQQRYAEAAVHMLDSDWCLRDSPKRAIRLAMIVAKTVSKQ